MSKFILKTEYISRLKAAVTSKLKEQEEVEEDRKRQIDYDYIQHITLQKQTEVS